MRHSSENEAIIRNDRNDPDENPDLRIDCSSTDLSWSSIVRVTEEMTHEQVDVLTESVPAIDSENKSVTPVFTGAFVVEDFLDPTEYADGGDESSRSSLSPQQDVAMEEVRESDSSSFEYVMTSSNKNDSPTLSDFSQMDVGVMAMSEDAGEENSSDVGKSRALSADKIEGVEVGQTEISKAGFTPENAPLILVSNNRGESTEQTENGSPREEAEASPPESTPRASIGAAAFIGMTSFMNKIDDDVEGYPSMDEPFARDELITPDLPVSPSALHVEPMLDNDVVNQEYSFLPMPMEYEGPEFSQVLSEKPFLAQETSKKVHPFIFAATDCTPTVSDDEDVRSRDAPPEFSVAVEQFEDLGENGDGKDFVAGDDGEVDDVDDPSLVLNAPFGNSFSEGSSLSASFRGSLPRQLSSSALANQLFARSRDGSLGEADSAKGLPAYDMDGVVADLREDKAKLEERIEALTDEMAQSRCKVDFLKAENQSLTSRLFEMEDSIRTVELEAKTRERNEEKTLQDTVSKLEKQNLGMLNQFTEENVELTAENDELKEDLGRVQKELDATKLELLRVEEKLLESKSSSEEWRQSFETAKSDADVERRKFEEERRRYADLIEEMTRELEDLKTFYSDAQPLVKMRTTSYADLPNKVADLESELKAMRGENAELRESKDELEVQLMNLEREPGGGGGGGRSSPLSETMESLEAEMERASKEELVKLVQSEKETNKQLKQYVDKVMLVILENQPELLEIMANMDAKTRG